MPINTKNTIPHTLVEFHGEVGVFLGPSRCNDTEMCIILSKGRILFVNTKDVSLSSRKFIPPLRSEIRQDRN
jgi:hypothetical protein